jgi:type IV secretory pathway VirB2 component (pilin)
MAASADLESTLTAFSTLLTGTIGKTVAGIALVGVGFGCFGLGKIPKSYLIAVVVGIGIVFGAAALVNTLAGS